MRHMLINVTVNRQSALTRLYIVQFNRAVIRLWEFDNVQARNKTCSDWILCSSLSNLIYWSIATHQHTFKW